MNTYQQLCGALGCLKIANVELPYDEIDTALKIASTDLENPLVKRIVEGMHRTYRTMCIDLNLINPGELFNLDDCIPLT